LGGPRGTLHFGGSAYERPADHARGAQNNEPKDQARIYHPARV